MDEEKKRYVLQIRDREYQVWDTKAAVIVAIYASEVVAVRELALLNRAHEEIARSKGQYVV